MKFKGGINITTFCQLDKM